MVKSTGILRKMDELGRIVLPVEARQALGIEERDTLEILVNQEDGQIILQKEFQACLKCSSTKNLKKIKPGFYLCDTCIQKLK